MKFPILAFVVLCLLAAGCGKPASQKQQPAAGTASPSSGIPKRVAYLAPTLEELSLLFAYGPTEDGKLMAVDIIESAVRTRVKGMSPSQAQSTIQQDADALGAWLTTRNPPPTAAERFAIGGLLGMLKFAHFDDLVK